MEIAGVQVPTIELLQTQLTGPSAAAIHDCRARACLSLLAFHSLDQLLQTEGFREETEILSIGQVLGESILGIARYENDLGLDAASAQFAEHGRAIHLRHDDVGHDKIDLAAVFFDDLQRLDARAACSTV